MIYTNLMAAAGVHGPVSPAPQCPKSAADAQEYSFRLQHYGVPPGMDWIFHPRASCCGAIPSNTWIEITHSATPGDEACGAWFYRGTGSGVWFNTGKTIAFTEHADAVKQFPGGKTAKCTTGDEAMSNAAATAGYDSVQFLGHNDGGTNDHCCTIAGGPGSTKPCRIEIVGVNLNGGFACTDGAAGAQLRAGWQGSRACACTEKALDGYVNCKGTPLHAPPPGSGRCAAEMRRRLPANRTHAELVDAMVSCSATVR